MPPSYLYHKDTWKVLDYIIEEKNPNRNLQLAINSNLGINDVLVDRFIEKINRICDGNKVKEFIIFTSVDSWGEQAEYIRTGLKYDEWYSNIQYAKKFVRHPRQLQLDLTVTLPGLFDLENMYKLHKELKVPLLCKKVFSFSPNNLWTPLCLPKDILHEILDDVIEKTTEKKNFLNLAFFEGLQDIKNHKTLEEKYDSKTHKEGLKSGKQRIEYLDKIRGTDIKKILSKNKKVLEWWNDI